MLQTMNTLRSVARSNPPGLAPGRLRQAKILSGVRASIERCLRRAPWVLFACLGLAACRAEPRPQVHHTRLVATVRSEPRSFNRLVASDRTSALISSLVHGKLVRINSATQGVEPWLAESWSSEDGRQWTVALRRDAQFSDGTPLTAADVLFSLEAVFHPSVGSTLAQALSPGGHPIAASVIDPHTVRLTFASGYGPGLRVLDALPILPRHRLAGSLADGTFRNTWSTAVDPVEVVGLGPFTIANYSPGQRVELRRNPHYWRVGSDGRPLPLLDELILEIVPDQNAEMLRLETGRTHLVSGELRPEDMPRVERLATQGKVRVIEIGVGLDPDGLWFNLTPGYASREPVRASWMHRREFRAAVSQAVDRVDLVQTIYAGSGVPLAGPVTPGNRFWHDPDLQPPPQDLARSRALLDSIGLSDRDGDGVRETREGQPVRLTLLTQRGNAIRERTASYLEQDLAKIGLDLDVIALDTPALVARLSAGDFDIALFVVQSSDVDPAANMDFWQSRGAFHLWFPSQQAPATAWEARLDELMSSQMREVDLDTRRQVFRLAQRLLAEQEPIIHFASPLLRVAVSPAVTGLEPGLLQPYLLWNADMLGVSVP